MGQDESGTLRRIKAIRREVVDPNIAAYHGRVVKTTGDGILIEYPSAVEAVGSAVAVQRAMAERNADIPVDQRIEFRIGVHQGDIVVDDQDIFGDGVNVAARLETLSAPGGICISGRVFEDMSGRLELPFEDRGEQQLKNIARLRARNGNNCWIAGHASFGVGGSEQQRLCAVVGKGHHPDLAN